MPMPGLAWDACCLINLVASGQCESILSALACPSYVVREVREQEAMFLRPLPETDPPANEIFDLQPIFDKGLLTEADLTPAEQTTFVHFASAIDDGEAKTAALAAHRGLWIATDDRDAIRLFKSLSPLPYLTTLGWLKLWAEATNCPPSVLGPALRSLRYRGRYLPRRATVDPELYDWWLDNYPSET